MTTYLTGTTLECLFSILEDGFIRTRPPHRVWNDYSEDYVYFVPSFNEHEEPESLLCFAFEQADFAISELGGSKRVVLEVENLNEELFEEDPDAKGIYAVRYPLDVPISCIKNIYLEEQNNSEEIKEFIAITKLIQPEHKQTLNQIEYFYCDDEEDLKHVYSQFNIKHVDLIAIDILCDPNSLEERYHDLREGLDLNIEYEVLNLNEFSMQHGCVAV
jgi:hypothetical protein